MKFRLILLLSVLFVASSCRYFQKQSAPDPAFARYIDGYTSGVISKKAVIRIQLAEGLKLLHTQNQLEPNTLFSFGPSVSGKMIWTDARTIEFRPDAALEPGTEYRVSFRLGSAADVPDAFETFEFTTRVIRPSFEYSQNGLVAASSSSLTRMKVTGTLLFADEENPKQIEKMLSVDYPAAKLPVHWTHDVTRKVSTFTIDNIPREKTSASLVIHRDGAPIQADASGTDTLAVPAEGAALSVLDVRAVQFPEQYLLVQFSDPLSVAQDLDGLITLGTLTDLRYTIAGSEVRVYAPDRLEGSYPVAINAGIENIAARKLAGTRAANIVFESSLPSVNIPGKGVILPGTGKLRLPFEAVNLNAVDVTIVKIYSNNVPQYLQQNDMNGDQDLRRVGKPVTERTIRLDSDKSLNLRKKNRFSLDIDQLVRTEPGAIYRITIGFRKAYSLVSCTDKTDDRSGKNDLDDEEYYYEKIDDDDGFWSRYSNYYPYGYNWEERDDPCSASYYSRERWASRNVIASNIGLIAKQGSGNSMTVIATDLLTTAPMSNVQIQLLDYQQQVIQSVLTGSDGLANVGPGRKPFMLLAKKGTQRGYLKLDDGSSLPLSRFEVGGDVVQRGIKGFLYGERGVWRPGDSLYLTFVLDDKTKTFPDDAPVSLELFNPSGQLVRQLVSRSPLNGFYAFHLATEADAPTGNWLARVKAGGAVFDKTVKIETVMPNRLRISFDLNGTTWLEKSKPATAKLSARWLFGAAAQNLKARVDVSLQAGKTTFDRYPGYVFDDPTAIFAPETSTLFNGPLNAAGIANVNTGINAATSAPGRLNANFMVRVFEPGGNFSIDNFSIPYHLYTAYAGIQLPQGERLSGMLYTDRNHPVKIVSVSPSGTLLAGQRNVQVELYKIKWQWWWDQDEQNLGNFTQDKYNQLLEKTTLTLNNGTGTWNLNIHAPDWGRYLIRVKDLQSGHTTGQTVYVDWPGWAQREQQNNPTEASMLSFTSDKTRYRVGEEATLTIPSSKNGRVLISLETGSKVIKTFWSETQQGQTLVKFKLTEGMAPNIYVNVSLLQPHSQTVNDLPIRMYGVIPLLVDDPATRLEPVISSPAVIRPETTVPIRIAERSGRPMTYTLAVVDDGLLDLTRFKTPDAHASFYAREALGVKTWDLFDHVLGAWGGDLERLLSIGGDADLNRNIKPAKSNRFKPVVKFIGPFYLARGEKNVHQVKLPPYIGSVRVMVVAGEKGAYGSAEKTVEVKKPLMLLATLPRIVGPGETFRLPITVIALGPGIKKVELSGTSNTSIRLSGVNQSLTFDQPGEKTIYADVQTGSVQGTARLRLTARSGKEMADYSVELAVRNANPVVTAVTSAELTPGQSWSQTINPVDPAAPGTGLLEVSSIPVNLGKRLNYLVQYPHGCVEQVTSSVFPQLVLSQLSDLSEQELAATERNVKAGILRLRGFQAPGGGFSYWPGERDADDWGSSYAGHFLLTAQAKGYVVPAPLLQQWKKHQRQLALSWNPAAVRFINADLAQAYRLYTLALAKAPEIGAMNRLKELPGLSATAKWRLSAAYLLIGQPEVAAAMVKGLPLTVAPYRQLGETYGSDVRDRAMIVETLVGLNRRKEAHQLVLQLGNLLSTDTWYSTQTTAYSLLAIATYCGGRPADQKITFSATINGAKKNITASSYVTRLPLTFVDGKAQINLTNQGNSGRLFVRITRQGQVAHGKSAPAIDRPDALQMTVTYKTPSGQSLDPKALRQGTDFIAEVTVKNPGNRGDYEQMALTQVFPAGWEIINTRLSEQDAALRLSPFSYRDVRDDRVLTYFDLKQASTHTYRVLLNASYTGKYFLPGTICEAMYDETIQARTTGIWVTVLK